MEIYGINFKIEIIKEKFEFTKIMIKFRNKGNASKSQWLKFRKLSPSNIISRNARMLNLDPF